jgi:ribosome-binding factor A
MESKRQKQVAETIRRNFGEVLLQDGSYMYKDALVTVTKVVVTPDLSLAKIYLSVYNTMDKNEVLMILRDQVNVLRQGLSSRIRKKVRRIPELDLYLDETLDEMYRLNALFDKLEEEKKKGSGSV